MDLEQLATIGASCSCIIRADLSFQILPHHSNICEMVNDAVSIMD